ncbi:AgaS family sugar isomerase [Winogradskya consettensis]|uniref:Tagatose-6-phosphate ketose/aldose isomerase n=1 Tax=Winogradskya consettensis TaxID=113560 RepID=A0A919SIQ6_9ACTN|nr:SIS domain-containing protein [Actinoplanes consettensis]GIM73147.1 putative tagatose-6-phosphate ketose/aldose isomerase [Actinoplanes consettensis]
MTSNLIEPATAREIAQQPALWQDVARHVTERRPTTSAFLDPILSDPRARIILTGAGTSAFIGQVLATHLEHTLGRRVEAIATTDLVAAPCDYLSGDAPTLLVSFARSGDSPESVAAADLADRFLEDPYHLIITCNADGALATARAGKPGSLVLTMPSASNDTGFAMTSSFTCMLLTARLTLGAPVSSAVLDGLVDAASRALEETPTWAGELARRGFDRIVHLGSGALQGMAREAALKMLELTAGQVGTWFDSPLGFRHGPKSVLTDRTLIVVHTSGDPYTRQYDDDIIAELAGHEVVVLSALPDGDDTLRALAYAVPCQIMALEFSLALGLTPDNPFPQGQVTRVVSGVRIHPV